MATRSELPAGDEWQFTSDPPKRGAKVRLAAVARRQVGRVRYDQIRALGVSGATISAWVDSGYLHPELPRVYAVGHAAPSTEGELSAALLFAGAGSVLSHATAAWWLDLLKYPSRELHVSTPRRIRSRHNIRIHGRRHLPRVFHKDLPVTTISQTILDFAASGPPRLLRLVLANADYQDALDLDELNRMMGRGVGGSVPLREALQIHLPALAGTRSDNEVILLELCERHDLPIPQVNLYLHGWLVDALWADRHLVVEVDGPRGHRSPAQIASDHQRDLELRAAGYVVLRYTRRQLIQCPAAVAADIRRHL